MGHSLRIVARIRTAPRRAVNGGRALAFAVALIPGAALAADCTPAAQADVALRPAGVLWIAPVTVDGRAASLLMDTGAERSVLNAAAPARLGLPPSAWTSTSLLGIGGVERHVDAEVAALTLGGAAMGRRLGPVRSLPVMSTAPAMARGIAIDGLLGADLLAAHDVELSGGHLLLHEIGACAGRRLPWATASVPMLQASPGAIVVPVQVAGVTFRALLDTGAEISLIGTRAAARLPAQSGPHGPDMSGQAQGIGRETLAMRAHDYGAPVLGGLTLASGPLWVANLPTPAFDMVLGMDRLSGLRLWLAYAGAQVFAGPGALTR